MEVYLLHIPTIYCEFWMCAMCHISTTFPDMYNTPQLLQTNQVLQVWVLTASVPFTGGGTVRYAPI